MCLLLLRRKSKTYFIFQNLKWKQIYFKLSENIKKVYEESTCQYLYVLKDFRCFMLVRFKFTEPRERRAKCALKKSNQKKSLNGVCQRSSTNLRTKKGSWEKSNLQIHPPHIFIKRMDQYSVIFIHVPLLMKTPFRVPMLSTTQREAK